MRVLQKEFSMNDAKKRHRIKEYHYGVFLRQM